MQHEPPMLLNMDDIETKRRLMSKVGTLKGLWEVTLRERKNQRSLSQNRYYFSAICKPFSVWLTEQWGETIGSDQAHIQLKIAIIGMKTKLNEATGEEMEMVPRSRNLDTKEFSEYIEKCIEFLARVCGIVVVPSELFHLREPKKQ